MASLALLCLACNRQEETSPPSSPDSYCLPYGEFNPNYSAGCRIHPICRVENAVTAPLIQDGYLYIFTVNKGGNVAIFPVDPPIPSQRIGQTDYLPFKIGDRLAISFVNTLERGFEALLFDISDPVHPLELSRISTDGRSLRDWLVIGNAIYLALGHGEGVREGLELVDISDPRNPVYSYDFPKVDSPAWFDGVTRLFAHVGNYAFMETYEGLTLIDVSDPFRPRITASKIEGNLRARSEVELVMNSTHAYWMAREVYDPVDSINHPGGWISVFDYTEPTAPREVGRYLDLAQSYTMTMEGNRLFITDIELGFLILDISNPIQPEFLGNFKLRPRTNASDQFTAVSILGNTAYVSHIDLGLLVLDISDCR